MSLLRSRPDIKGAAVTPFLLKRVNQLTAGASLRANIALVKNNAGVGAAIASSLSRLQSHKHSRRSSSPTSSSPRSFAPPASSPGTGVERGGKATVDTGKDGGKHTEMQDCDSVSPSRYQDRERERPIHEDCDLHRGKPKHTEHKHIVVIGGACVDTQVLLLYCYCVANMFLTCCYFVANTCWLMYC